MTHLVVNGHLFGSLLGRPRNGKLTGCSVTVDRPWRRHFDQHRQTGGPTAFNKLSRWPISRSDKINDLTVRARRRPVRMRPENDIGQHHPEGKLIGTPVYEALLVVKLLRRGEKRGSGTPRSPAWR